MQIAVANSIKSEQQRQAQTLGPLLLGLGPQAPTIGSQTSALDPRGPTLASEAPTLGPWVQQYAMVTSGHSGRRLLGPEECQQVVRCSVWQPICAHSAARDGSHCYTENTKY